MAQLDSGKLKAGYTVYSVADNRLIDSLGFSLGQYSSRQADLLTVQFGSSQSDLPPGKSTTLPTGELAC